MAAAGTPASPRWIIAPTGNADSLRYTGNQMVFVIRDYQIGRDLIRIGGHGDRRGLGRANAARSF